MRALLSAVLFSAPLVLAACQPSSALHATLKRSAAAYERGDTLAAAQLLQPIADTSSWGKVQMALTLYDLDRERALALLDTAIAEGHVEAYLWKGLRLKASDSLASRSLVLEGARRGDWRAEKWLAGWYMLGRAGRPVNLDSALYWTKRSNVHLERWTPPFDGWMQYKENDVAQARAEVNLLPDSARAQYDAIVVP